MATLATRIEAALLTIARDRIDDGKGLYQENGNGDWLLDTLCLVDDDINLSAVARAVAEALVKDNL